MVGQEVCRLLTTKGHPVRALIRPSTDKQKVENLTRWGVQLMEGDVRKPASLKAVLSDIDTLITTISSMPFSYVPGENDIQSVDQEGVKSLIDKAKAANVQQFIYTSFSKHIDVDFPLQNAKRAVEAYLQQSGLTYTILRPSYFMEVWLSPAVGFDAANAKATLYGEGTNKVSYISLADVAKFAVACVGHPAAQNAMLELGGPESISQIEAVQIFETLSGRQFAVQNVTLDAIQAQKKEASDPMQQSFSGLMECLANGDKIDMAKTLKDFPTQLKSVQDFAREQMS